MLRNNAHGLLQVAVTFKVTLQHRRRDVGVQRGHSAAKVVQHITPAKRRYRLSSAEGWAVLGACVTSQLLRNGPFFSGVERPLCSCPSWQQLPECSAILTSMDYLCHWLDDVCFHATSTDAKTARCSRYLWRCT